MASIASPNNNPIAPAGTAAAIIKGHNFGFLRMERNVVKKTMSIAIVVGRCKNASSPCSLMSYIHVVITKCPLLEIGKNSAIA